MRNFLVILQLLTLTASLILVILINLSDQHKIYFSSYSTLNQLFNISMLIQFVLVIISLLKYKN